MSETVEFALEMMAGLADVRARRLFGGYGIFQRDLMFALVSDDVLYFKADAATRREFTDRGLRPFSYAVRGKPHTLQYYEAPPDVWDDADAMRRWAELALRVAHQAATRKKPARSPRPVVRRRQ